MWRRVLARLHRFIFLSFKTSHGRERIKTEDMVRSGEASLWFNPTSHMLVQPFAYKKLCENVLAFRFKCGARRG